ncbi:MAG: tellurite resistance TerB family protein [Rhodospirillales bacterium]|nr:tellurite resistance TerB family protein [Rhodospirillales bacterium]MBO6785963.1 tellurite resistance TerB family protein [Rhodospirillales bacterium]
MGGVIASLSGKLQERLERQRNRPFLEGVMAACALVATTDGEVSFAEQVRVDQILQTLDKLKVFDPHEGVEIFREFTDAILENPHEGHARAIAAVAAISGDVEAGALLLRICLAVSEADGEVSLADQIEIVSMCSRFGIDPADCGLYIDMPADEFLAERIDKDAG